MKNIHVLPTDKPSRLSYFQGRLLFDKEQFHKTFISQNIYITSDEEIKEGDWFVLDMSHSSHPNEVHQMGNDNWSKTGGIHFCEGNSWIKSCKKIVLTTDQDLIKDGVQAIDDEFLEWFVKNPSCGEVEVESGLFFYAEGEDRRYKIIIPSEEPKQETTLEEAQKQQFNYDNLHDAKEISSRIKVVETIEESAERIISDMGWVWENTESSARMVARHCAKSQERMYSEEDMREAYCNGALGLEYKKSFNESFYKWFEQYYSEKFNLSSQDKP